MALPQSVIEQMEREPSRTPGWSGQLLMFSGTIFFISILIYLGLAYGYKSYLNASVQKLEDQIQSFGQQVPIEEQNKIASFYSQLANLKMLLANHVYASPVFGWLEKNTQVNVFYTKLSLNAALGQLSLGGSAKTVDDFNQQVAIFEKSPEIQAVKVGGVTFVNGFWQFDANLTFAPKYFYGQAGISTPPPASISAPTSTAQ